MRSYVVYRTLHILFSVVMGVQEINQTIQGSFYLLLINPLNKAYTMCGWWWWGGLSDVCESHAHVLQGLVLEREF